MSRSTRVLGTLLTALVLSDGLVHAQENPPDDYLCYTAGSAYNKRRSPIGQARVELRDRLGGPHRFAVRRISSLCNPASIDGKVVSHATVHLEGLTLYPDRGAAKFARSTLTVRDRFATRPLVLSKVTSLLDVTKVQAGTGIRADFGDDPTRNAVEVNRFKCYDADPQTGVPKLVPPSPTVTDQVFTAGQPFDLKRVSKVCLPADADGATPGAEARDTLLVCYRVKLPKGAEFARAVVSTRTRTAGVRTVGRRKPAELCVVGRVVPGH